MDKSQVFELLEQNKNQRGIDNWQKMTNTGGLSSYGMGLTVHRKLAKKIGRSHELAAELWASDNYDAKVIGLLIDEPKKLTEAQIEAQVEELNSGMLVHVFSSCDATLPKASFAFELAKKWLQSEDTVRRRCAFGLVYEFSKKTTKKIPESFYFDVLNLIETRVFDESKSVRLSMGTALMGIGKRSKELNAKALKIARMVGPIDFNEDGQKCDPFDVEKHLTSDYLKQKLGLV